MPLPTSRERTYAPLSQLFSADLNKIQDEIIALHTQLRGPRTRKISPLIGRGSSSNNGAVASDGWLTFAQDIYFRIPIELAVGERILEVRAKMKPAASGSMQFWLHRDSLSNGAANPADVVGPIATSGSAVQTLSTGPLTELELSAGILHIVTIRTNTASVTLIGPLVLVTDIPP